MMKRPYALLFALLSLSLVSLPAVAQTATPAESFIGDWGLKMDNGGAGWMPITRLEGVWEAELWTVGEPKKITDLQFAEGRLTFVRQCKIGEPEFIGGPPTGKPVACHFVTTIEGDSLRLVMQAPNNVTKIHVGKRLPPMPPKPDLDTLVFGEPIQLFNGVDLTGWQLSNPKQINGWKALDGVLVNDTPKKTFEPFSRYGNLRTERAFGDGKLTLEFNVPEGGNSGVYVRGAYEAQVVDRDSKMQGINGIGAIFGRIEPSKNAGKAGGEWQSYEITIVDRHATVVLNGETVIYNQPIRGNTNGSFQADFTLPGPLYLQGDHTSVSYRHLVFHPLIRNN